MSELRAPGVIMGKQRDADALARLINPNYTLTAQQRAIVESGVEPTLVVAGAGSGKTETLSLRIVYVLDNARSLFGRDISPDEVMCLTFTRKAAAEIAERAAERINAVFGVDPQRPEPSVSTYNSYAAAVVSEHGLRVAVDPAATVVTDAVLWQRANDLVETWIHDLDTDWAVSTVVAAVPKLAAAARDHAVTPAQLREWAQEAFDIVSAVPGKKADGPPAIAHSALAPAARKLRSLIALADVIEEFDAQKRADSLLDFSDQVEAAVRLAALPEVGASERERYVTILLDEFQDTSPPQLDLFARMFGADHAVMAVGDPHQAIYGFRGASAQALTDFVDRFGGDAVRRHSLSVSWRNDAAVLAAANTVVAPLQGKVSATILRSKGEELGVPEPSRSAPAVVASRYITPRDEAEAVADFIVARKEELRRSALQARRESRPITAAVLCRRRAQFEAVTQALAARSIPYEVVGLGGLLDVPEVADVLALLTVAHDPSRADTLMRLLVGERLAIGPRDLAALHDWAKELAARREDPGLTLVDALAEAAPQDWVSANGRTFTAVARRRLENFHHVVDAIRRHGYLPVTEQIIMAERAWNLDIEVDVMRPDIESRRAIDALVDAARGFMRGAQYATIGAFLAWIAAARDQEDGLDAPVREPDPYAVQILTVHASKGLEWDVVAIPGLNDSQFPKVSAPSASKPHYTDSGWLGESGAMPFDLRLDRDSLPQWDFRHCGSQQELIDSLEAFKIAAGASKLDEERRLFYVALTRARSHVLLSGAWYPSASTLRQPSVFLRELIAAGVVSQATWLEAPHEPPIAAEAPPVPWPQPQSEAQLRKIALAGLVVAAHGHVGGDVAETEPLGRHIKLMLDERAQRLSATDTVTLPAHVSASALVSLGRDRDAFAAQLRRPVPTEPSVAAARGSALHAWIEAHYGHPPLWEDLEDLDFDANIAQLKANFEASPWSQRTPLAVEIDVELRLGEVTVRSRIDAVFPPGKGLEKVTVVDWKTGREPVDPVEQQVRQIQLAMYRLAWASRQGVPVDDVDAVFVYLASGTTFRPPTFYSEQDLLDILGAM